MNFIRKHIWLILPTFKVVTFLLLLIILSPVKSQNTNTDSLENILKNSEKENRVNVLMELAIAFVRNDTTRAMTYLNESLVLSKKINYCYGLAKGRRIKAMALFFSNNHQRAIDLMKESAEMAYNCQLWELVCENYNGMAATYLTLWQNYNLALDYYFKSYKILEEHMPGGRVSLPLMGIANVYKQKGDLEKALEYYQKAAPLVLAGQDEEALTLLNENLGELYFEQKKYDLAKDYYLKSLALFEKQKKTGGMIFSYVGLAKVCRQQEDFTSALTYGTKALALSDSFKTYERAKIYGCESLGRTYLALNDNAKAKNYFLRVVEIASRLHMIDELKNSYEALATIAERTGDFKNAFTYQRLHTAYADSVMNKEKALQIAQMEVQLESEKKQKEIEILQRDKQLNQFTVATAIATMLGLLIFSYMMVSRQRMKHKKDRELSEMQKQILEERTSLAEAELENKKLTEDKLKQDLDFKTKELTTSALNLIQKNEALENLKKSVEEIRRLPEDQLKSKLNSIINSVNFSFSLDKDWDNFRVHFEQVHKGFFQNLLQRFPDLTPNDLKICALTKLQLETKEMASILDISPESAKVARHRLRKKLNLSTDQNLSSFLASF